MAAECGATLLSPMGWTGDDLAPASEGLDWPQLGFSDGSFRLRNQASLAKARPTNFVFAAALDFPGLTRQGTPDSSA